MNPVCSKCRLNGGTVSVNSCIHFLYIVHCWKKHGILVLKQNGHFELVFICMRFLACKSLGINTSRNAYIVKAYACECNVVTSSMHAYANCKYFCEVKTKTLGISLYYWRGRCSQAKVTRGERQFQEAE